MYSDKVIEAAKIAFRKQVAEKVEWLSGPCWYDNLEIYLKELSCVIEAGMQLGVAGDSMRPILEPARSVVLETIKPLKRLDMVPEIRQTLIELFTSHGGDATIFTKVELGK